MSKKRLVGDSKTAAASYFAKPQQDVVDNAAIADAQGIVQNNLEPETVKLEKKINPSASNNFLEQQNSEAISHVLPSKETTISIKQSYESEKVFSIKLNKKKKRDKAISVRVNSEEYAKFSEIVSSLELNTNDIINQLINEFVRTNNQ